MGGEIPPAILAPIASGISAAGIIAFLLWALNKKDNLVTNLQEARVADQKERAKDALAAAEAVQTVTRAAEQREAALQARWALLETTAQAVRDTARAVEINVRETTAIRQAVERNALRLDDMSGRRS
jgi:hypothetical protein